jgi:hypothetical protein
MNWVNLNEACRREIHWNFQKITKQKEKMTSQKNEPLLGNPILQNCERASTLTSYKLIYENEAYCECYPLCWLNNYELAINWYVRRRLHPKTAECSLRRLNTINGLIVSAKEWQGVVIDESRRAGGGNGRGSCLLVSTKGDGV